MSSMEGKVAIVTGASKGLGKEIACQLASKGVKVVGAARSVEALKELQKVTGGYSGTITGRGADLRDARQCDDLVRWTVKEFGRLDILVNNAGLGHWSPVETMTDEQWRETMDVNLDAVFYLCRAAVREMKQTGGGRIVNIASVAARRGAPGVAAYGASKAALINFSEGLSQEVKDLGIQVNIVSPGTADTPFRDGHSAEGRPMTPNLTEPQRMLTPVDVASAVMWVLEAAPSVVAAHVVLEPRG